MLIEDELDTIRQRVPATTADLTAGADGVRLTCRAHNLAGMAQLLAGLGAPFTVIEPEELREKVAELATRLSGYATRVPDDRQERAP